MRFDFNIVHTLYFSNEKWELCKSFSSVVFIVIIWQVTWKLPEKIMTVLVSVCHNFYSKNICIHRPVSELLFKSVRCLIIRNIEYYFFSSLVFKTSESHNVTNIDINRSSNTMKAVLSLCKNTIQLLQISKLEIKIKQIWFH